jgi:hypothetical protein
MDRLSCEDVEKSLVALTLNPRELSESERAAILAQMDGCAGCRELYEDYVRISAGLLHAVPARVPPPALKASLMARVQQSVAQPAPVPPTVPASAPTPARPTVRPQPPARNTASQKQPSFMDRLREWWRNGARVPGASFGLAAVALVAAGVLLAQMQRQITAQNAQMAQLQTIVAQQATQVAQQQQQVAEQQQQISAQEQLLAVLTDPGAQAINLNPQQVAPNAQAKLQFNPDGQIAVLSLNGLPELQASQQYQLWLFDSTGTPLPSTTFDATAKNVVINAEAKFGGYVNFAVSVEPKGGSQAPTGPIALIATS